MTLATENVLNPPLTVCFDQPSCQSYFQIIIILWLFVLQSEYEFSFQYQGCKLPVFQYYHSPGLHLNINTLNFKWSPPHEKHVIILAKTSSKHSLDYIYYHKLYFLRVVKDFKEFTELHVLKKRVYENICNLPLLLILKTLIAKGIQMKTLGWWWIMDGLSYYVSKWLSLHCHSVERDGCNFFSVKLSKLIPLCALITLCMLSTYSGNVHQCKPTYSPLCIPVDIRSWAVLLTLLFNTE